jgi:hypothetical protein
MHEAALKSVQSAGISDLLPSGRMTTNCKPEGIRACRVPVQLEMEKAFSQ